METLLICIISLRKMFKKALEFMEVQSKFHLMLMGINLNISRKVDNTFQENQINFSM